jgi:D-arabinose 5-phosphate isomerase GutQ
MTALGVAAPTTSTTVALALGDALAMAAAKELHADVSTVFAANHPGGAIGAAMKK